MKNPKLVILAAGMGSRYGGLKQIDTVDEAGHIIIDYSIYDAMKAGFRDFVFIIKKEIEADFRQVMDAHTRGKDINVSYVFQELYKLPEGYSVPDGRKKPWGTAHAIACCVGVVDAPFAVVNADDYYGENAFKEIYQFLKNTENDEKAHYCMVGYRVANTVTDKGAVTRGVCQAENGYLTGVTETYGIETDGENIFYTVDGEKKYLDPNTIVSMNLWGFGADFVTECKAGMAKFLDEGLATNPEKCEYYIPTAVADLIKEGRADVKVLETNDQWHGVTYKEDKPDVVAAFKKLIAEGKYPEKF
jgi:dTDP-glucose pyrophosphorylase